MLKALRPVLYASTEYETGDALPVSNTALVEAWIECGSAAWCDDDEDTPEPAPKAVRRSALSGATGIATPSHGPENDLVGRVPDPELRGAVKEPSKRRGKKSSK